MAETTRADDARTDDMDSMDTGDETEPATRHDVAEGGVLGAVGGAIVGGLAGGPLGALIGAVVGGVASAGAVDVVDKHDHDFAGTPHGDAVPEGGAIYESADTPLPPAGAVAYVSSVDTPQQAASDMSSHIRERAYEIYDQRGRGDGQEVQDWLEAEREVPSRQISSVG